MELTKKEYPIVPEYLANMYFPQFRPLSPQAGFIARFIEKRRSRDFQEITLDRALIAENLNRMAVAQSGTMKESMTLSSDVELHFARNEHLKVMFRLKQVEADAKARTALAEAERTELELLQYKKAMNDS